MMIHRAPALTAALLALASVGCKQSGDASAVRSAPAKSDATPTAKPTADVESTPPNDSNGSGADAKQKAGDTKDGGPADPGDLEPRYGKTENTELAESMKEAELLEHFCEYNNAILAFPFDVPVVLEDCGEANAFYDPDKHEITLCYELVEQFTVKFDEFAETEEIADAQIQGATTFTLYHELGHALAHIYELPITGNEEDAVDQLATLVLLASGEEGREQALDGAEAFLPDEAEDQFEELPFWGVHSLGEQRFYNTLCLTYGQDPDAHQALVEDDVLPRERAEQCPKEYGRVAKAWETLLRPHLKPK